MTPSPDFGSVIQWADATGIHSRPAIPTAIDTKAPVRRVRRCDPLDTLPLEPEQRQAARVFRQSVEHVAAGKGMGPLPWGRDLTGRPGSGMWLGPQERALSAADWYRRGIQAMGLAVASGVVQWAVIDERGLRAYEMIKGWRHGLAMVTLTAALDRLAGEYGI